MAGGVTGVSAGNRTSYDPSPPGRSSISMGRGSAHGSMSSDSGSVSVGLILTLLIPSFGREPAKDYNVLSGRTQVRRRWPKPVPAKDYNVLSGVTRSNQESHKELQRPVGTWSQNKVARTFGQEQVHAHVASDETCHFRVRSKLQKD